jgi:hypothetical protein
MATSPAGLVEEWEVPTAGEAPCASAIGRCAAVGGGERRKNIDFLTNVETFFKNPDQQFHEKC